MTRARPASGMASVEYVGIVAAVGLLLAGLVVLRAHTVGRRAPVRPIPAVVRVLGPLITTDRPPGPVRPPRPPRPRPHRPPRPPAVVDVPDWLLR